MWVNSMNDVNVLKNNGVNLEASLEYLGDMETYDDTLKEFLGLVDGKLSELKKYKEAHDMANYAIHAHSLKSDARYLGFTSVGEIALSHEMAGKEGREDFVIQNYDAFVNAVNNMVRVAKEYLNDNESVNTISHQEEVIVINEEQKPSILVADDSDIVRNFITKMCGNDYNIVLATDGQKAIEELEKENNIKCILLDLNMPNVDGFRVLEYLQSNNLFNKYPVSIITGADDRETITDAFKYPIVDMLNKPFNERDARRIIERTISYGK